MFELKDSFIYKACKKIETTKVESENLDLLRVIAININKSFFYFYDVYKKVVKRTIHTPKSWIKYGIRLLGVF